LSAMLPSLCRLCIMASGSNRASGPAGILADLPPAKKSAPLCFWNPASSAFLLLRLRMKKIAPTIAIMATTPTTTPAAMPATLGPDDLLSLLDEAEELVDCAALPDSVTTTVLPGATLVMTDAEVVVRVPAVPVEPDAELVVDEPEEDDEAEEPP